MSDFCQDIKKKEKELEEKVGFALDRAKKSGATDCEISIASTKGLDVSSRNCELENIEFEYDRGMVVTVYKGMRKAHASTTDLSPDAIEQTIGAALDLTRYTNEDPCNGVLEPKYLCTEIKDFDVLHEVLSDTDEAVRKCIELEKYALDTKTKGITKTDGAAFSSTLFCQSYGSSNGFMATSSSSYNSLALGLIGENGGKMQTDSGFSAHCNLQKLYDTQTIAREAIDNTVAKLDVKTIETGAYNVIFSKRAAISLFSRLFQGISGGAIYRKSSFLTDTLGKQIFPDFLTVREDPFLQERPESSSYDNEGCRRAQSNIVENGVLNTYLLSSYTARKLKMEPNGHNGGVGSTFVTAHEQYDFDELLRQVNRGLVITKVMGPGVDIVSGNYSQGASGYFFDNGRRVHAVDEITIASNLRELFMNIKALANDYDQRYKLKCPSFLIENITVSAK